MKKIFDLHVNLAIMLTIVLAATYDWSFGIAIVFIVFGKFLIELLLKAEDREEARINAMYATPEIPVTRNIERDDNRFKSRMEEEIIERKN